MLSPSPVPSRTPSYATVLRTPHATRTFGAALLGRLSYGMVSLSLMLAVNASTGSYSVAGAVMAVFGATSVFLSPARAALIDRYGPRRVLPPLAGLYAVLLAALAYATWRPGAPALLLGVLTAAAGASTPPLGPVMRTLWSDLVADRELLRRAYSLDGVAEELLFVSGPLLVGLVVKSAPPAAGVAISAALVFVGTLALVSSPAVRGRGAAAPEDTAAGTDVPPAGRRLLGIGGLRRAVLVTAAVGLCLGGLDLLVVAFTEQRHQSGAVSWVLAALSAGSAVGGLAYGAVSWRASNRVRLPLLAVGLGATMVGAGLSPNVYVLVVVTAVAGLFIAPALTTAYLIADESVGAGSRTQAGAWVNTAINAGSSVGVAVVGLLVDHLSPAVCFAVAAVPALLCAAVVTRGSADGDTVSRS
ncbi:MFS transporter [Streptomyces sp. NBC_00825]|uniref:MFS transporter n=1 Tax=unclassified Streptomyces TaxID=2593676 RepID=UPI002ED25092|nr:MFS transporter [Streptomyces sp. NBC_00826]WTH89474.1 MFS transporter [Streptomyces sp. NBC_00825]WTH98201.1 MFS transporter [Streptomyces sp. NBC_00822]